ncbi:MAG TPA: MarC family protein [Dongiaceae bacterium]|nr:MarC family protein [Dongiaceae bacterium]
MSTWTWLWGDFTNDLITIWVIIDPISTLPIFIALTSGFDRVTQRRIASGAVLVSLVVLFFFICLGQLIITAMGISLRTFEIAGGLILFIFAVELVIGEPKKQDVEVTRETPMQLAIYPLAIPNLAGPGAMLTVILRTDNSRVNWLEQFHTTAAVAGVLAVAFVLMLLAGPITRVIGIGGANVIKRIMGMIIAAYAAHLVFSGIGDWLHLQPL